MHTIHRRIVRWAGLAALFTAGVALASNKPPEISEEGLHLVKDSKWGLVYEDPEAVWTPYTKVIVLEPYVAFKKNWQRDQNRSRSVRVTDADMERIKTSLAQEFDQVFREVLEADDGYPVVDTAGEDTLILRPAIINLDVNAPDTLSAGRTETYAETAGEMTIYMEVYDSVTGHLMAKGLDRQADRRTGFMTWQTSASNRQAALRILKTWAQSLRDALDEIHDERD